MPTKTNAKGREYEIDGKKFTWHADVDPDLDEEPFDVVIPLRMKLGTVRDLLGTDTDATVMFAFLERLIPNQADKLDELDLNDFMDMFTTWQSEYETLTGASLGESAGSST